MNTSVIPVAIVGNDPVTDLLAQRIQQRKDLNLIAQAPLAEQPPADCGCLLFVPSQADINEGVAETRLLALLESGFNLVTTLPLNALPRDKLLAACRKGSATFHGTGGFQTSLATRFNRAIATITRDIETVQLIEQLQLDANALSDQDADKIQQQAAEQESYYDAGLRTLAEAVFGHQQPDASITFNAQPAAPPQSMQRNQASPQGSDHAAPTSNRVIVRRELGKQVTYDSLWTSTPGEAASEAAPLRYQLTTKSKDAVGDVYIHFHSGDGIQPTAQLTCKGLLDAVTAVCRSGPGILHNDLDINHVKSDDRLN